MAAYNFRWTRPSWCKDWQVSRIRLREIIEAEIEFPEQQGLFFKPFEK